MKIPQITGSSIQQKELEANEAVIVSTVTEVATSRIPMYLPVHEAYEGIDRKYSVGPIGDRAPRFLIS